ncbi:MAG: tRNA lysidine(34) synthetase TilS [Tepidiformaceae bacterium]
MFRRVQRVLVAVSGGPDSVATLLILLRLRERFGFEVVAAHFDHQLRTESAHDLDYVRALCAGLGVSCSTGEGDVRAAAGQQKAGIEEVARRMRYQFLGFIAEKERADCIATGHTADDQAETVLMRIVRGTGVRGLRGMLPVSEVPGSSAQRLVRPALCITHVETVAICAEAGISPLIDASNTDTAILRNQIRHETMAALREVNPAARTALGRLASNAREVFAGVERQAMQVQPLERAPIGTIFALAPFAALPNEARTLVIEREAAFFHLEPEVNATRVRNLRTVLARGSGEVRFGDTIVEASSGSVRVGPQLADAEPFEAKAVNVPGVTLVGPWRVLVSTSALADTNDALTAAISPASVRGVLRLRALTSGDRMRYHGRHRLVSDILSGARVPKWSRTSVVALADAQQVVALFTSAGVFADAPEGDDVLSIRVGAASATQQP